MNQLAIDLGKEFDQKIPELKKALEDWFEEESKAIDGSAVKGFPSGPGGSVLSTLPIIDSKRVLDATIITEEILKIALPPEIIKPGGYDSCDAMLDDILPKLRKVYTGEMVVKKPKPEPVPVAE